MKLYDYDEKWLDKYRQERSIKAVKICKILKFYNNKVTPVILDLGCFEGKMEEQFKKYTDSFVIGIETSFQVLRIAVSNRENIDAENVSFIVADANYLPIKNEIVDWLVCNQVIDCMEDKVQTLQEFDRTLKSDGLVYLSTGNKLILKFYKKFPKFFIPFLGPYYGRFMTSSSSKFQHYMYYRFWKKTVLENTKLAITDITSLVATNKIKFQDENSKNWFIRFFYYLFHNWSPTWVFILQHNVLERKNK